jgi:hypothetical protein
LVAQYYFNILNATSAYRDNVGERLFSDEHARKRAATIAEEYASKDTWVGWSVQVVNETGDEIERLQIGSSMAKGATPPTWHAAQMKKFKSTKAQKLWALAHQERELADRSEGDAQILHSDAARELEREAFEEEVANTDPKG